jgi:hypothetical protein
MKIRELLQMDIWGKRTSRKILVGFGIVFAVAVIGFCGWYVVGRYWLTPGERSSAMAALVQIDALRELGSLGNEDFASRANQAKRRVDSAEHAAWTGRDESVSMRLGIYLIMVMVERHDLQKIMAGQQASSANWDADRKANGKISSSLHQALD